jgi:hypothetical protein
MDWKKPVLYTFAIIGLLLVASQLVGWLFFAHCDNETLASAVSPDHLWEARDEREVCHGRITRTLYIDQHQHTGLQSYEGEGQVLAQSGSAQSFGDVNADPLQLVWKSGRELVVTYPRGSGFFDASPGVPLLTKLHGVDVEAVAKP